MPLKCVSVWTSSFAAILCASSVLAQTSRITQPVSNAARTVVAGNMHPKAVAASQAGNDQGRVAPSLALPYITVTLSASASQQADLKKLLADQQTPGSPDYHRWLTPEDYGQRFGVSDADISKISGWLQQQGFNIISVARGRTWIAVSGTAAQAEAAFQTEIHHYLVDGETHYANASEPSVPAAFGSVVKGIRGLNDFRLKPRMRPAAAKPHYTGSGDVHYVAPGDFAAIYDVNPLYSEGINGSGQAIAVAGQIEVVLSDIQQFRSNFNLPSNDPQMRLVPGSANPGSSAQSGDLAESDIDLEWSGAVAPNATIIFVYSTDAFTSAQYAIDQHLAPILSVSYGNCELETPTSEVNSLQQMAEQANAEGMTWFAASGDDGAADCDDSQNPGLAVDLPGSIPEVTSSGGTEFAEGTGNYWSLNTSASGGSALSYIPETTWNDSVEDAEPSASGGGKSVFFSKPSWQTGSGVPSDGVRDVPDISLNTSDDHDPYMVYTSGSFQLYGGTSFAAPTFAGMTALLNQKFGSTGQGNINPKLYALAQSNPGIFHDITSGNNIVTVACSGRDCSGTAVGYYAGTGYDLCTGIGSVDMYKLVTGWNGASTTTPPVTPPVTSTTSLTLLANLTTVSANDVVYLIATATATDGTTPTGSVAFSIAGSALGSAALTGTGASATATLGVSGSELPAGSGAITATYNSSVTASVNLNVTSSGSGVSATPSISGIDNGASFKPVYAPGETLSIFGTELSPVTWSASSVPLPITTSGVAVLVNGVVAPLYYVSASQLNVQIPYETGLGSAVLSINNNGHVTTQSFQVTAAAPGIFTTSSGVLVPTPSAALGEEVAFYVTGAGAVSPAISDGAAPPSSTALADLPAPTQRTTVTIGGVNATIDFIGIPWALVGVTQINVQVPNGIATGSQPVVVTVGGVSSAPGTITVTP